MQMSFGDHQNMSNGFFPMMMIHHHQPPPPPSPSSPQNPNNGNTHFLSHQEQLNCHGNSPVMLQDNAIASTGYYFMDNSGGSEGEGSLKAKIMVHPHYPKLLAAYVNCQKIGAPPDVAARLQEACGSAMETMIRGASFLGEDPSLDQFMEAYCEMLCKYEEELAKPFKEAMFFLSRIECQFKSITLSPSTPDASARGEVMARNGSSEEDMDMDNSFIDPCTEDMELKGQLLRKYSGYLGDLKQEFMKKRKKGKLPKEARQQLLEWWSRHYKWPYPSEADKLALAESTHLDQKQINNWFINQRKRHWKPSEDIHFIPLELTNHYLDNDVPFPMT